MDYFWSFKDSFENVSFKLESYVCEYFEYFLFWSCFIKILVTDSEGVELFWE